MVQVSVLFANLLCWIVLVIGEQGINVHLDPISKLLAEVYFKLASFRHQNKTLGLADSSQYFNPIFPNLCVYLIDVIGDGGFAMDSTDTTNFNHYSNIFNELTTCIKFVGGFYYSYPYYELGITKRHAAALADFALFHEDQNLALVIENNIILSDYLVMFLSLASSLHNGTMSVFTAAHNDDDYPSLLAALPHSFLISRPFLVQSVLPVLFRTATIQEELYNHPPYTGRLAEDCISMLRRLAADELGILEYSDIVHVDLKRSRRSILTSQPISFHHLTHPRVCFMIAIGKYDTTYDLEAIQKLFLLMNPGYTLEIYDNRRVDNFLGTLYPQYIPLYWSMPRYAWKADLIRYLLLYEYGGFYLDIDAKLMMGLDEIMMLCGGESTSHIFLKPAERFTSEIANGFIFVRDALQPMFIGLVEAMARDNPVATTVYTINLRRLYDITEIVFGTVPDDYASANGAYFIRELSTAADHAISPFGYVGYVNNATLAMFTNHKPNWPPLLNQSDVLITFSV